MKNNPLAIVCVFFALGIWISRWIHIPLFLLYAAIVLFLSAALSAGKRKFLFSICLIFAVLLSGSLHLQNSRLYPPNHVSNFVVKAPQNVYLQGEVISDPEFSNTPYSSRKANFIFKVSELRIKQDWHAVEGLIKVSLYGEKKIAFANQLLLGGSLVSAPALRNPGGFDYQAYLVNQHIFGLLRVQENDLVELISSGDKISFIKEIFKLKHKLSDTIASHFEPSEAAILSAIILGERAGLSDDVKDLFINTGTIHILAISGLHVGLLALILIALLKFLRLKRNLVFIFTILFLIAYALLSGGRASVVRATIMAIVVLLGMILNRQVSIYNSLGLAGLIILGFNPQYIFDVGFGLSFASVICIVYFAPKIEQSFPVCKGLLLYLIRAFSVSAAAWIGVVLFVARYFHIVSPVAILANLVVIPLLFVVVASTITFLVFTCFFSGVGVILANSCSLVLATLMKTVSFFSIIPFGFFYCPSPNILFFIGYYGILGLIFNYKKLNLSLAKLAILVAAAANVLVWKPLCFGAPEDLRVTFLDVGHGDAIFIEFPQGETMLIDGGRGGDYDSGEKIILPFLRSKGINKIDAVLLTHPDQDHLGGLLSVLKNIKTNYVFDSAAFKKSKSYDQYRKIVKEKDLNYRQLRAHEQIIGFAKTKLFVLHPSDNFITNTSADINNNSLVLKLIYGKVSFLFCGDIQQQGTEELLKHAALEATVIKVPHHGSDEGLIQQRLLEAVAPKFAVISADEYGRFDFAPVEVMARLQKTGARVYKTSEKGAIIFSTNGQDIWIRTIVR